jgi:hypothetical protein
VVAIAVSTAARPVAMSLSPFKIDRIKTLLAF